ncbi:bifunctional adenosylcobinamide kinase/adenosylcobinamide-phosphate guanylyltransferase [Leptolyngbya sp. GGD]|uniref:bifunctional adenosylcobinamide kinase/adenosylcobinamide-phosphate guanylyltransferase n=1 Tax=Leptolyngbya sp. GGD TaxID=2997907 RepID=UPI00227C6215|nr:bifunctional adenosylcobinamide kinase/adenosylcobinamide-phosphate guanylyltransferase [Leptolyngbya sp. GGD]MCY6490965.1 bifunctional adenosylcobinamide kinase/adenosylcobinamide-phosphate guanylyltransferase [Leptolyngbya sp. GGD]
MAQVILVTGAARSGKSEWAEKLATDSGQSVIYIATAQENSDDPEWQARIELHRSRRPLEWQTQSVPVELSDAIANSSNCLLIDSLGTWLANLLDQSEPEWEKTIADLFQSFEQTESLLIFVAEETGWGVVPAYPIGRVFRDRLGNLTRRLGAIADTVYLVVGGHVLNLSQLGMPLS